MNAYQKILEEYKAGNLSDRELSYALVVQLLIERSEDE